MTYDLLDTFKKYFEEDKVIIDTYELADGYYYVFDEQNNFEKMQVIKGQADNYELEKYIKTRDFYSKYITANKVLDTGCTEEINSHKYTTRKKIFSNNQYTLFFKNRSLLGICSKDAEKNAIPIDIFKKGIEKYYESLLKLGTKAKEKLLIEKKYTEEEIKTNKEKMLKAFYEVYKDLEKEEMTKETWIKIFLKQNIEEYKRVSKIYIKTKIFNTNDKNIKIGEETYGSNNYNFGLNNNKPYLELKSTPFKVGSLVKDTDIEIINKMYIWLYNNAAGKDMLKLPTDWSFYGTPKEEQEIRDKNAFMIKVTSDNGNARIDDYRYISKYNTKIREFTCKNYLEKEQKKTFQTENIYELRSYTNNIWIAENEKCTKDYIKGGYNEYDQSKTKLSNWKKDILKKYKDIFLELFEEENPKNFINKLDQIAIEIIEKMYVENLNQKKEYLNNPRKAFNLWIAYKEYFNKEGEDEGMKINNLQSQCEEIIEQKGKIETDEQYYFLAGQVAYYLLNQSKAEKLTQDVTEPFIKANTVKKLKEEIDFLYRKYNYNIYLNHPKFNNIYSQILLQEPEEKIKDNKEIILAGILSNNLFYSKQEKIDNGGNEDGKDE